MILRFLRHPLFVISILFSTSHRQLTLQATLILQEMNQPEAPLLEAPLCLQATVAIVLFLGPEAAAKFIGQYRSAEAG